MNDALAEKWLLGDVEIKNRFSTLPMEGNDAAPDGTPSGMTIKRYQRLASGGWGIIYVEAIAPGERAKARPGQLVLTRRNLDAFKRFVNDVKSAAPNPPAIIFQINHAGRYALRPLLPYRHPLLDPTWDIPTDTQVATVPELEEAARASASALLLCAESGADGADVKCCHGYLNIELARPANGRDDSFGGTIESRMRFMDVMLDAASSAKKPGFFFGSRISLLEGFAGGLGSAHAGGLEFDPESLAPVTSRLRDAGAAFICETMGIPYYNPELVRPHARYPEIDKVLSMHHRLSSWVKNNHPGFSVIGAGYTMLGGGFSAEARKNIESGLLDAVGFGRQSFADPEFPAKYLGGDADAIHWCKGCKSSNCSYLLRGKTNAGCVIYDKFYKGKLKELKNQGAAL